MPFTIFLTVNSMRCVEAQLRLAAKGIEVLLLTDAVDEFWIPAVGIYEGKPFKSATEQAQTSDKIETDIEKDSVKDEDNSPGKGKVDALIAMFKLTLNDEVKDVRVSERLTDSAVCLVSDEGDMDLRVERMLKQQNQLQQSFKRILEINPRHALITALAQSVGKEGAGEKVEEAARLLLTKLALLKANKILNLTGFSRRLNIVMASALPV